VTDFGIARIWNPENKNETSGTPGYMGNLLNSNFT
jgi:p70 ribosomal S6 kinase